MHYQRYMSYKHFKFEVLLLLVHDLNVSRVPLSRVPCITTNNSPFRIPTSNTNGRFFEAFQVNLPIRIQLPSLIKLVFLWCMRIVENVVNKKQQTLESLSVFLFFP